MSRKNINNKRIGLIFIFLSVFISGTILIFTVPSSVKITYGYTTITSDGTTIAFNIFEPQDELYETFNGDAKKKAVIIGHGVMVNKEMLKGYAIELAAAGFVAVPLDFRGHGQSTSGQGSGSLVDDVIAVKDYLLSERDDIDPNNFGYIGYSMGGGPGWSIVMEDISFKCMIGIGTGMPTNSERTLSVHSGRRLNVLMILGRYDGGFTLDRINRLKEGMSLRLGVNPGDVHTNKLYGSFQDGTASKIYIDDNSNHLLTAWDQDFIREARDWVKNTFYSTKPVDENFYVNIRALILVLQLFGGLGLFFIIVEPFSRMMLNIKGDNLEEAEPYKIELPEVSVKNLFLKTLVFTEVFGIFGTIIFLLVFIFLPLSTANFFYALLYGQVVSFLLLLWRLGRKVNISFVEILKRPFKRNKKLLREILLGAILGILLYIIIMITVGLNYLGLFPSISKLPFVPIYYIISFIMLLIFGLVYNVILQNKFEHDLKGQYKSALLTFGVLFSYLISYIFVYSLVIGSFFYFENITPISIGVLSLMAFSLAIMYQKTGNIVAGSIIAATFFTLFICTLSPLF